jgi:hypothetical protein
MPDQDPSLRPLQQPDIWPCPKCAQWLPFKLRPDTQHWGEIRCAEHGHFWVPKPAGEKPARPKRNWRLIDEIPREWREFCWTCRREAQHLAQLRPVVVLQVHHVIPVRDGGSDDLQNLQVLCAECHAEVHRRREAFKRYTTAVTHTLTPGM